MIRKIIPKLCLLLLAVFIKQTVYAQSLDLYQKHWMVQNGDTLPYRLLLPENYDAAKTYPLVLFLHGRGESGTDNERQLANGAQVFLRDSIRKKYPAIVVFPQCAPNSYWSNVVTTMQGSKNSNRSFHFVADGLPSKSMQGATALMKYLLENYPVQKKQVYVMGLSMGGMGTFEMVRRMPAVFAAAIPICGGAHPATAKKLVNTSWWVFHGLKDDVVLPEHSTKMVNALKKAGAKIKYTTYPNANHNSWDPAFAEPGLLPWLFSQRKK